MAHKIVTQQQAIDMILSDDDPYYTMGFRGDDFIPVRKFRKSSYHGDEESEFQLSGVSAIVIQPVNEEGIIKAITKARKYGKNVFLLKGEWENAHEVFNDPGEILFTEHKILAIVEDQYA